MPKGRLMVVPATVEITVHDAIPTAGLTREDARALATRVQDIIAAVGLAMGNEAMGQCVSGVRSAPQNAPRTMHSTDHAVPHRA